MNPSSASARSSACALRFRLPPCWGNLGAISENRPDLKWRVGVANRELEPEEPDRRPELPVSASHLPWPLPAHRFRCLSSLCGKPDGNVRLTDSSAFHWFAPWSRPPEPWPLCRTSALPHHWS